MALVINNKADGDNEKPAELAAQHFKNLSALFPPAESGWVPEVLTYSGYYGYRIDEVWDMIDRFIGNVRGNGYFQYHRNQQTKYWMYETINEVWGVPSIIIPGLSVCCLRLKQAILEDRVRLFCRCQ